MPQKRAKSEPPRWVSAARGQRGARKPVRFFLCLFFRFTSFNFFFFLCHSDVAATDKQPFRVRRGRSSLAAAGRRRKKASSRLCFLPSRKQAYTRAAWWRLMCAARVPVDTC